ncbi:helix-turn-helix domain-containing protein [Salinibacterium sp. GXW1014]|uniref:helix-turn-helix domain-containing protein n=1 Tax=Salinibacterium sp. GXW1014 TaxID=3377838 RepID=UPI00383B9ED0
MSKTQARPIVTLADARSADTAALTIAEAARVLGVDPRTVSASAAAGELPSVRIGRRVLIPREPFLALFEPQMASAR